MSFFPCFCDMLCSILGPWLKVERESLWLRVEASRVIVRWWDDLIPLSVFLPADPTSPCYTWWEKVQRALCNVHTWAYSTAKSKGGKVLQRGELRERFFVCRIFRVQPSVWIKCVWIRIQLLVAMDSPTTIISQHNYLMQNLKRHFAVPLIGVDVRSLAEKVALINIILDQLVRYTFHGC